MKNQFTNFVGNTKKFCVIGKIRELILHRQYQHTTIVLDIRVPCRWYCTTNHFLFFDLVFWTDGVFSANFRSSLFSLPVDVPTKQIEVAICERKGENLEHLQQEREVW